MPNRSKLAVLAGTLVLALVPSVSEAASPKKQECKKQKKSQKCTPATKGRMTGHGHQFNVKSGNTTFDKVQWEFRNSVCNQDRFPDLKVEFGRNRFILESYSGKLTCLDTALSEGRPVAGFDTITGQGSGTLNGEPATARFTFGDGGEPGRNDTARIEIFNASGKLVLDYTGGALDGGNHQAHRR